MLPFLIYYDDADVQPWVVTRYLGLDHSFDRYPLFGPYDLEGVESQGGNAHARSRYPTSIFFCRLAIVESLVSPLVACCRANVPPFKVCFRSMRSRCVLCQVLYRREREREDHMSQIPYNETHSLMVLHLERFNSTTTPLRINRCVQCT